MFLSITMEQQDGGLRLHQMEYLENKLKQREIKYGRPNPPTVEEGKKPPVPQEERENIWYKEALKKAQAPTSSTIGTMHPWRGSPAAAATLAKAFR